MAFSDFTMHFWGFGVPGLCSGPGHLPFYMLRLRGRKDNKPVQHELLGPNPKAPKFCHQDATKNETALPPLYPFQKLLPNYI